MVGRLDAPGLCVLVGVTHDDTEATAERMAAKVHELRILPTSGPRPTSGAPLLVISQFTLYGDARKGRRPTWNAAAPGPVAEPLVEHRGRRPCAPAAPTSRPAGSAPTCRSPLVNDGPVTLILEI